MSSSLEGASTAVASAVHPLVGGFFDESHLYANKITCDWKCITVVSVLGGVYIWHLVVMIEMGAWAGGNMHLVVLTVYSSMQLTNNLLQVLAPGWYWNMHIKWVRLTMFSLSCLSMAMQLALILEQIINVSGKHSLLKDLSESVTSQFNMMILPTTLFAATTFTFEMLSSEIFHQVNKFYESSGEKRLHRKSLLTDEMYLTDLEAIQIDYCNTEKADTYQSAYETPGQDHRHFSKTCANFDPIEWHCEYFPNNRECRSIVNMWDICQEGHKKQIHEAIRKPFCYDIDNWIVRKID